MLFNSSTSKPQLASISPTLEAVEAYVEALKNYPKQPTLSSLSSIQLPKEGMEERLWEKAVSFAYTVNIEHWKNINASTEDTLLAWLEEAKKVWFLLLQMYNVNPNGIAIVHEECKPDIKGSYKKVSEREKHYLVLAMGENLTSKELVFDEFMTILSIEEADDIYKPTINELKPLNIYGMFKFINWN